MSNYTTLDIKLTGKEENIKAFWDKMLSFENLFNIQKHRFITFRDNRSSDPIGDIMYSIIVEFNLFFDVSESKDCDYNQHTYNMKLDKNCDMFYWEEFYELGEETDGFDEAGLPMKIVESKLVEVTPIRKTTDEFFNRIKKENIEMYKNLVQRRRVQKLKSIFS